MRAVLSGRSVLMLKNCRQCGVEFEITDEDLGFYDKISPVFGDKKYAVPEPSMCPACRMQRRTAWRNERHMYRRKCGKCEKDIVTVYGEGVTFPVYCNKCWWGDSWDGRDYGQEVDFSRPFFEQLREVMDKTPQLAIQNDNEVGSVNCEYCQDFAWGKNCYLVVGSWYTEDSFHSSIDASYNRSVCDCTNVTKSELAYECIGSRGLYNCAFVQDSENCSDCTFGIDLKGCRNCFGCVGLRQKEFYIFNEPYSEEEYRAKVTEFDLGSYEVVEKLKVEFLEWSLNFPRKNMNLQNCENSEGNYLFNCRNTHGFSMVNAEGCKFSAQGDDNKFSYDIFNSGRPHWCLEGITPDDSYLTHFSWFSWKCKNCLYAINCHSSEHLFGCVSLHRAKYCILNKQYSKEEYEKLVPRIIEHMNSPIQENAHASARVEYGEFMDAAYSFFPYNETVAAEYFPLSKEEVLDKGWKWKDPDPKEYLEQTCSVADHINDVPDEVCLEILKCAECEKNYKIIPQELKFYKKMELPVPRSCPNCRHSARLQLRTPYTLWERACGKCEELMKTAYPPERPEIVWCEKCYLGEVY